MRCLLILIAALGIAGCYSSRTAPDGRTEVDTGTPSDAATVDTSAPSDAATVDTSAPSDAATVDVSPRSRFEGSYEGTYMGAQSGTVFMEIRADGSLTIELNEGVERHEGTIRVDGALNADGRIGTLMVRFAGHFTGDPGSHVGTGEWWFGDSAAIMGTWELHQVP